MSFEEVKPTPRERAGQGDPLDWRELLEGCCPRCGTGLEIKEDETIYKCPDCLFMIGESRRDEICEGIQADDEARDAAFGDFGHGYDGAYD